MIECQPGIYEVLLETDRGVTNKINIFIIPGNKGGLVTIRNSVKA